MRYNKAVAPFIKARKIIRLDPMNYRLPGTAAFLTICADKKASIFIDNSVNKAVLEVLESSAAKHGMEIWAYCLMPDHMHLVIFNASGGDIIAMLRDFKRKSALHPPNIRWQRSYYDHLIRKDEAVVGIVEYVLQNPVRKGLVARWQDYPWSFSKWHQ
jgi:putative transposase